MGLNKKEIFSDHQNTIAKLSKALVHPARIAILRHLIKIDTYVTGKLVNEFRLARATISQHLKELKDCGLIKGTIECTRVRYCIDREHWTALKTLLSKFLNQDISKKTECC